MKSRRLISHRARRRNLRSIWKGRYKGKRVRGLERRRRG